MNIYALGLLHTSILPHQVFFEPTQDFIEWINHQPGRIIDCGCGVGLLSSLFPDKVFGIDLYERDCPLSKVYYGMCATEFPFNKNDIVLIARPDHSGWHYEVFKNALNNGLKVIYIGLPRNYDSDLYGTDRKLLVNNAGQEGEQAWQITNIHDI